MTGIGLEVQDAGLKVQGAGLKVQGAGLKVQDAGLKVQGAGLKVQGVGLKVQGSDRTSSSVRPQRRYDHAALSPCACNPAPCPLPPNL